MYIIYIKKCIKDIFGATTLKMLNAFMINLLESNMLEHELQYRVLQPIQYSQCNKRRDESR